MGTALVALIIIDLIISAARASLLNVRLPFLLNLQEGREQQVEQTAALVQKPRLRVSLRLAITLVHFLIAGVILSLYLTVYSALLSIPLVLGVMLASAVLLMLGEFAVEWAVLRNPEETAIHTTSLGKIIDFVMLPFSALLLLLWGAPTAMQRTAAAVTEDELRTWVEEGQPQGGLEKDERRMIYSIFQFSETLIREIMVPRIDVLALDVNSSIDESIQAAVSSGHSRFPVYENTVDNIIGVLHVKDLLRLRNDKNALISMREVMRPAYFVPESKKVDELLAEMQSSRVHMAVVVDEYGGVAGLVTLEDIVEEIVGEIRDEYDQAEEMLFQQINENEYVFLGKIDLDEFNEVMGSRLEKEQAETLGGFIYSEIGRVPAGGELIKTDGLLLTVEQVLGRRIRKVRAQRLPPTQEKEMEGSNAER